ncbi:hypothetical protein ACFVX6_32775 [Streptomyces sp. NPDC058289]|uniref:hypothetical protein n=1 Tax=Streptomyces sp. NPDC058289 TaxID=3346425 RepID=UPI0036EEB4AC
MDSTAGWSALAVPFGHGRTTTPAFGQGASSQKTQTKSSSRTMFSWSQQDSAGTRPRGWKVTDRTAALQLRYDRVDHPEEDRAEMFRAIRQRIGKLTGEAPLPLIPGGRADG